MRMSASRHTSTRSAGTVCGRSSPWRRCPCGRGAALPGGRRGSSGRRRRRACLRSGRRRRSSSRITPSGVHGTRPGLTLNEPAEGPIGEPVDVLRERNQSEHGVSVEMIRQRQLHEDSGAPRRPPPARQLRTRPRPGDALPRQADVPRTHARRLSEALLAAHVALARLVVSDEDCRQTDRRGAGRFDLFTQGSDDLVTQRRSVHHDRFLHHRPNRTLAPPDNSSDWSQRWPRRG